VDKRDVLGNETGNETGKEILEIENKPLNISYEYSRREPSATL